MLSVFFFFWTQDAVNTVKILYISFCCSVLLIDCILFLHPVRAYFIYIDGEGLWNKRQCLALTTTKQGRNFIVPHLLWHGTSVYVHGLIQKIARSVASYDKSGALVLRIYSSLVIENIDDSNIPKIQLLKSSTPEPFNHFEIKLAQSISGAREFIHPPLFFKRPMPSFGRKYEELR